MRVSLTAVANEVDFLVRPHPRGPSAGATANTIQQDSWNRQHSIFRGPIR